MAGDMKAMTTVTPNGVARMMFAQKLWRRYSITRVCLKWMVYLNERARWCHPIPEKIG